jgi:hypothetical protein
MAYLDYNGLKTFWDNIKNKIAGKQDKLTFDPMPIPGSSNPVISDGIDSAISIKANSYSPTFTGTPQAPTAAASVNNTQIATTAFVKTAINNTVEVISRSAYNALTPTQQASKIYFIYEDSNSSAS